MALVISLVTGIYFDDASDVRRLVETVRREDNERIMIQNNLQKIQFQFNWEKVINEYENFILECYNNRNYEVAAPNRR